MLKIILLLRVAHSKMYLFITMTLRQYKSIQVAEYAERVGPRTQREDIVGAPVLPLPWRQITMGWGAINKSVLCELRTRAGACAPTLSFLHVLDVVLFTTTCSEAVVKIKKTRPKHYFHYHLTTASQPAWQCFGSENNVQVELSLFSPPPKMWHFCHNLT